MNLQEFKAWFDGFTENVGDKGPTIKQWKRIKDRVGEIDGVAVTERVYIDRWYQPYRPYYTYPYAGFSISCGTVSNGVAGLMSSNSVKLEHAGYAAQPSGDYTANGVKGGGAAFNPMTAMFAAGQAEAASID